MQLTNHSVTNELIKELHAFILSLVPKVVMVEYPGYRSNQYGLGSAMKDSVCYIICYDEKANFGFDDGVTLQASFSMLKGSGKRHRHVAINQALLNDKVLLTLLINKAFNLR